MLQTLPKNSDQSQEKFSTLMTVTIAICATTSSPHKGAFQNTLQVGSLVHLLTAVTRNVAGGLAACSCYFSEYRSMLRELHATRFHVAACTACMNHRSTSGTSRTPSKRQNFVDAVVTVGYNDLLAILTRR